MDSVMAIPREGHLNAAVQMFSLLKSKHNEVAVLDPIEPEIDQTQFPTEDWSETPCKEDAPSNKSEPMRTCFTMRDCVESGHAGDSVARQSRTSFIVILKISSIFVFSNKQRSCETSSFGSELITTKS